MLDILKSITKTPEISIININRRHQIIHNVITHIFIRRTGTGTMILHIQTDNRNTFLSFVILKPFILGRSVTIKEMSSLNGETHLCIFEVTAFKRRRFHIRHIPSFIIRIKITGHPSSILKVITVKFTHISTDKKRHTLKIIILKTARLKHGIIQIGNLCHNRRSIRTILLLFRNKTFRISKIIVNKDTVIKISTFQSGKLTHITTYKDTTVKRIIHLLLTRFNGRTLTVLVIHTRRIIHNRIKIFRCNNRLI